MHGSCNNIRSSLKHPILCTGNAQGKNTEFGFAFFGSEGKGMKGLGEGQGKEKFPFSKASKTTQVKIVHLDAKLTHQLIYTAPHFGFKERNKYLLMVHLNCAIYMERILQRLNC